MTRAKITWGPGAEGISELETPLRKVREAQAALEEISTMLLARFEESVMDALRDIYGDPSGHDDGVKTAVTREFNCEYVTNDARKMKSAQKAVLRYSKAIEKYTKACAEYGRMA